MGSCSNTKNAHADSPHTMQLETNTKERWKVVVMVNAKFLKSLRKMEKPLKLRVDRERALALEHEGK